MVEEQPCIEAPCKIDFELIAIFLDRRRIGTMTRIAVLATTLVTNARLREHVIGSNVAYNRGDGERIVETMACFHRIDRSRRSVFCDVQIRVAPRIARTCVHIYRNCIIGKVRIVHAIAGHALAGSPLATFFEYLAQPCGKLLGRLLEHFDFMRCPTS